MEFVNSILNDLKIPIIIWEGNKSIYSNTDKCIKGTVVEQYLINNNINNYEDFIKIIMNNKTTQYIRLPNKCIQLQYIDDTKYYEIHYPNCENNNILALTIHKIRKPLTNIINVISLSDDILSDSHLLIKQSCYSMLAIINDLIDILNINKDKLSLENKIFNITTVIDEILKMMEPDVGKKNININRQICNRVNKMYYGDYDKIKQILMNIIKNAIKYTIVGGIYIEVKEYMSNYKSPYNIVKNDRFNNILFKIKDTGIGINDDTKKNIDNMFNIPIYNYHDKIDKLKGFGLFISYNLCRFLNGYIWYKSDSDVGTVFYIVIPIIPGVKAS